MSRCFTLVFVLCTVACLLSEAHASVATEEETGPLLRRVLPLNCAPQPDQAWIMPPDLPAKRSAARQAVEKLVHNLNTCTFRIERLYPPVVNADDPKFLYYRLQDELKEDVCFDGKPARLLMRYHYNQAGPYLPTYASFEPDTFKKSWIEAKLGVFSSPEKEKFMKGCVEVICTASILTGRGHVSLWLFHRNETTLTQHYEFLAKYLKDFIVSFEPKATEAWHDEEEENAALLAKKDATIDHLMAELARLKTKDS